MYSYDVVVIRNGERLFGKHCTACHNFYHDDLAPELSHMTSRKSFEWIKTFIQNPAAAIKSGDTTATKLFEEYKTVMPSFSFLNDDDLNAVISYIHAQHQPEQVMEAEDTHNIKNPIPDTIETSGVTVGVKPFAKIPASSDEVPRTRIIKLDFQPGSNDVYVLDLRGKFYKISGDSAILFMDMAKLRPFFIQEPGMATGFGSFAFHPDFVKNGLFYTTHAEAPGSGKADFAYGDSILVTLQWVLTEWKMTPETFPFRGNSRELLRIDMPTTIHGIQEIAFNSTAKKSDEDYGLLYLGIGDGGSTSIGKPLVFDHPAQIWGSIIRIDPSGNNSANRQYGIPQSNPFAKNADGRVSKEIYAYGFRNPHRFSWSKAGQLLAVNIGEHNIESVNLIEAGHFYGWPIREGTFAERFYNHSGRVYPLPANDSMYHVTYPVAQFDHDEGTAISGGFEYTGSTLETLKGKFIFGDIGTGKLFYIQTNELKQGRQAKVKRWNVSQNGTPTTLADLCGNSRVDMRLGVDARGEMYILTKIDGKIYRLVNHGK
ncbi:MAG: PQQ-dependent sugar dehydrogenase [Chitinophagaceae bacterium]|nr:PQQ-dependent sugar dehydrogenase [Chitinophagaceae bacterium]